MIKIEMKNYKKDKKLDIHDKKILYELDINSRASAATIARKIRLSKETVNFRIKRLLKRGNIKHFYSIINASHFGYQYYKIFFKFNKIAAEIERKIIDYLRNEKSCANLRVMEGAYDMCFVAMHRSPSELKEFLSAFYNNFGDYLMQKSIHTIIASHKLNQKILFPGKTIKNTSYHGKTSNYSLDKIDLQIIKKLSIQARIRLIDLARVIKEDPKVVRYHIKKLERDGIITGYFTALNLTKLNREFIQLDISLKNSGSVKSIIEFFDKTNSCIFAYELLGRYDLSLELYAKNDNELRKTLAQFKEKFLQDYIFYDISHIYREFVINWSPFDAYSVQ